MKFGKKKLSYNFENVRMWGGGEEEKNKKKENIYLEKCRIRRKLGELGVRLEIR